MSTLKDRFRRLLRSWGYDIVSFAPAFHTLARRARLLAAERVDVVLDVGANTGQYGSELRQIGYAGPIVSFEPVREAFDRLAARAVSDGAWQALNLALGAARERLPIHVSHNLQSSSLLEMLPVHAETAPDSAVERDEFVAVERLDAIIDTIAAGARRAYLKMDAQGYEPRILDGATGCLDRIAAIQSEVSLVPLYEGECRFVDFVSRVGTLGFELVGVEPGFSDAASGRVLQVDCIFARPR